MHASRRVVASVGLAGLLAVSGVACSSSKGGSNGDFCNKLRGYEKDSALNGSNPSDSASMDKALKAFDDLAASAPSEIKPDVDTMKSVLDLYKQIQKDPTKAADLAKNFDEKKITAASKNIEKYATDTCGVKLSSS